MYASVIANFIKEHNDWEEALALKRIKVKKDGDLTIFNYLPAADFSDALVQEARGIILDGQLNVVCWPFRKFGNFQESYADSIDWASAKVQDKIDGSIIKLYYHNGWQFATNAVINAKDAQINGSDKTFYDVIVSAKNYSDIPFDKLNKDTTYIFELVSPQTQVVVPYANTKLIHIGTRNNLTGLESNTDIGIEKPMEYPIATLDDCIEAAKKLNGETVTKEGFVVVDKNYHRIKVKSPAYLAVHGAKQGGLTKERALELIRSDNEAITTIKKQYPYGYMMLAFYEYEYAKVMVEAEKYVGYVRNLYEELNFDRKAVALTIKSDRLKALGFSALDNDIPAIELFKKMKTSHLARLLPDFEENEKETIC